MKREHINSTKGITVETAGLSNTNTAQPISTKNNNADVVKEKTRVKKGQRSPARMQKSIAAISPIVSAISPIKPGLTIVSIRDASLVPQVRNTFMQLAKAKSKNIGLPMPDVETILSLYSGNHRQLEQAKGLALANKPLKSSVLCEFQVCGTRDGFDWVGDEGLSVLLPIINDASGWVTLEQQFVNPILPSIVDGLSRVRHAAQQAEVRVMLYVVCTDSYEKSGLHELCDEYIEVFPCEPDSGQDIAFSIDCVGLRNLNHLGIGRTMCNIKLIDGVYHRNYTEFTSASLETRMMCFMRGQKMTFEEIGNIFNKDKSTIQRRLKGLKSPKCEKLEDGWLEKYLESSNLDYCLASSKLDG